MKKALIIIDIQNDFLPGGSLAITNGDEIVPAVNDLQDKFDIVVATQDWHPANHGSFASSHHGKKPGDEIKLNGLQQVLWPDHCVQGSSGAEFSQNLRTDKLDKIFLKGTDPQIDSYSGFFDNGHYKSTGLGDFLREEGVEEVYLVGLATDYCVKYSAIDALKLGFKTYVIKDATRAVNAYDEALSEMKRLGVEIIESTDIL